MRILALIAARGGSKRVPGKNIRPLEGRPLITWTIDVAKDIPEICDILVSTDDPAIAKICADVGAYVPWLRPAHLATDSAKAVDVAIHALDFYERERGDIDGILLLQPTSPFRTRKTIEKGLRLFDDSGRKPVLAVSQADAHPMWALKLEEGRLAPYMSCENGLNKQSQDLPPVYSVNGSFYLITPLNLREYHSFVGPMAIPLIVESPHEAIDIDTEWDFVVASLIAKHLNI